MAYTLHDAVWASAQRHRGQPAVIAVDRTLTYAELMAEAHANATGLRARGIGRGDLVGVMLERDSHLIPALLGVQMAGAAYVPLDPAYPSARIAALLEDSRPAIVITVRELAAAHLGPDTSWIPPAPATDESGPALSVSERDLAYLIYTSGSTGRPKGVMIEHGAAMDMLRWAAAEMPAGSLTRVLASTSVCFDLSIFELFLPLTSGHCVILERSIVDWHERGCPHDVTLVNTVPSALAGVVAAGGLPSSVRVVNVAGEPLPGALVDDTWRVHPWLNAMYNLYGPSEDTTYSTFVRVFAQTPVSIGFPLPNTLDHVVSADGSLAGPGEPGELWLGGAGLARGYMGQPSLTAERFVPDPFSTVPGRRAYRTGDLVCRLPAGELAYLGRIDDQLKIRGFRIEPGEVVATLTTHPDVLSAVVAAATSPAGDARLVAYVRLRPGVTRDGGALLAHAHRTLPAYMCPQVFVWVDAWPLTPNGKIDRRALPAPDWAQRRPSREPASTLESAVLAIWREVLGVAIGPDDDFFVAGGDSLTAMRITARLRQLTGQAISLDTIFRRPTVSGFAAAFDPSLAEVSPAIAGNERTGPRTTDELSFGEERLFFLQQIEPSSAKYNMAYAWRFVGVLDTAKLERALDAVASRHAILRTGFFLEDHPRRRVSSHGPALRRVHAGSDEALRRILDEEPLAPFDLDMPPLWRACLVERRADDHTLVITLHHAIADAWSIDRFAAELAENYNTGDLHAHPPAASATYDDYIAYQRVAARSGRFADQLAFWVARLRGTTELALPIVPRRPGDTPPTDLGAMHRFVVPLSLVKRLEQLRVREGVSSFMLLMATWCAFLHRISGQTDICVGVPVSDRTDPRFQDTFGYFLNTLVLRNDLSDDPSFVTLLARVRETTLEAFAHQDLPFDEVVRILEPVRDLRRTPLVRTALVVQAAAPASCPLDGLERSTCEELFTPTTKFDLSLFVTEQMPDTAGWWAALEYSTALFTEKAVATLADQWLALVERWTDEPALPISAPRLSTSPPGTATPPVGCPEIRRAAHLRFVDQVARTPFAVAVDADDGVLTYAELENRAQALAGSLLGSFGKRPVVVLDVHGGHRLVVAILAVAMAGGAYMPVDPATPDTRIRVMLANAGAVGVLSAGADATAWHGLPVIDIDAPPAMSSALPVVMAEDTLYVMHTSGSTGMPKGVRLLHRAMDALVGWYNATIPRGVRMSQIAPAHFDMSSLEIFATLSGGGTLVMGDRDSLRDPVTLARWLGNREVEQVYLPVVMLDLLARAWNEETSLPGKVTDIVTAGEALVITPAIREFVRRRSCRLWNQYGPTETHVATAHLLDPCEVDPALWPDRPPIGRPVDGTTCHVLDAYGQPCPPNIAGNLFIGGDGVAEGYAGQPALTAARFLPDPFANVAGRRMYRSGDRACRDDEGTLRFLGREDRQVKVRGYRVEPGDIESVLLTCPGVAQVRVLASPVTQSSGEVQLLAYVVATQDGPQSWRRHVAEALPPYMVPTQFIALDALPLTPNGKVDERRLPAPTASGALPVAAESRTATETRLAELWCSVLGMDAVANDMHFFECGGNSFSAMRLVAAMQVAFGMRIPLHVVFTLPTIRDCAAAIDKRRNAGATA